MKRLCLSLAFAALGLPAQAGTDVGVSIGISQPGLYGRIDIGSVSAPPVLVYPKPVVIVASPVAVVQRPIYLHVPPGHAKDWRKHCGHYGACGQPVYFVQEGWYQQHYAGGQGQGKSKGGGKGKGHGKHDG
ncbi:MAG: hypothetical protein ACRC2B_02925 [Rubrivivax sp.]